jgi:hypothetical protein
MSCKDLIASAIGSAIGEFITLPISTMKTNYQTNLDYKNAKHVFKDIARTRGVYGFYSASLSSIAMQIVSISTKFTFYSHIKHLRNTKEGDLKNNMLNGMGAGIMSSMFSHPVDVIKVCQQNGLSMRDIGKEFKNEGAGLLYRGFSKTLTKSIFFTSTLFPLKDFFQSKVNNSLLSSAMASFCVTGFLHPIDYLKIRQIANQELYPKVNNVSEFFRYYYRGFGLNLSRVVPHFMITMFITEQLKLHLTSLQK